MARKNDDNEKKLYFQMDRFVQQDDQWFYITREGEERGPFESMADAEEDLVTYVRHLKKMDDYGE